MRGWRSYLLFAALCAGACIRSEPSPTPSAPTPTPPPARVVRDLPYAPVDAGSQSLDVYIPGSDNPPYPIILAIHGAGGDKTYWSEKANGWSANGYAVIAMNYRELPQHSYPASAEDAFCALAWIHSLSAAYGLDPGRIVAVGYSEGATLASLLGAVDRPGLFMQGCPSTLPEATRLEGVVGISGLYDTLLAAESSTVWHDYLVAYFGAEPEDAPDMWSQASPSWWVGGGEPPFLLVHGQADQRSDPNQAEDLARTLEGAGVEVRLLLLADVDHETILVDPQAWETIDLFIATILAPS